MFIIVADERKQMYMNWNEKDKQSENIKLVRFRKILPTLVSLFLQRQNVRNTTVSMVSMW
jgi:hypothetical protein